MAIRSIIYLNYKPELLAFDNTGAPLLREVCTYIPPLCSLQNSNMPTFQIEILAMDMLARTFKTSFTIEILPLNDNRPVIKLFTLDNCSVNSNCFKEEEEYSSTVKEH